MTNKLIQDMTDEELAELSEEELMVMIDKSIKEVEDFNVEMQKKSDDLSAKAPADNADTDAEDEIDDKKFMEETEGELDLGLNEAILDLATDEEE
jgi:hypothetical protein